MRKLLHLEIKDTHEHKHYGSLTALFLDNKNLGIGKSVLDRWDFRVPYENKICVISKTTFKTSGDIRDAKLSMINDGQQGDN